MIEKSDREEAIGRAMELIEEAQSLVDAAIEGTMGESHYLAYGRYGFDQLLNNGNPYDSGLDDLVNPKHGDDDTPLEEKEN